MTRFHKALIILIGALVVVTVLVVGSLVLANKLKRPEEVRNVTSRTVLEKISDNYFIVTKTVIVDQKNTIEIDEGSKWSNFWWGQTIDAEGLVRIDIGVDMSKVTLEDVTVDNQKKTVTLTVPQASILDASQYGDIEVNSKKGLLKFLLENSPNEDHNLALEELIKEAEKSVVDNRELLDEARDDSVKLIELIVKDMGYELVVK